MIRRRASAGSTRLTHVDRALRTAPLSCSAQDLLTALTTPAEMAALYARQADELAAIVEALLGEERAAGGRPRTLTALNLIARALGEQHGELDELAQRLAKEAPRRAGQVGGLVVLAPHRRRRAAAGRGCCPMSTYTEYKAQKLANKVADREQDRADRVAERAARLEEMKVRGQVHVDLQRDKAEQARLDRAAAKAARAEKWAAVKAWVRENQLMTPVIATSVLLSWTGMAVFGSWVYGILGFLLPLFSEGLFVAFAVRITKARKTKQPVGRLMVGLVLSGIATAAMQAIHGLSTGSWERAAVMALVSVAGVIAHQLITADTRVKLSPADRIGAEIAREIARREHTMRLAAVRQAAATLDEVGNVALTFRPGQVTLTRTRPWRRALLVEAVPVQPVPQAQLRVTAVTDSFEAEFDALVVGRTPFTLDLQELPSPRRDEAVTGVTGPGQAADAPETGGGVALRERPAGNDLAGWIREAQRYIAEGVLSIEDNQRTFRKILGCQTKMAGRVQQELREQAGGNSRRGWLRRKADTTE